MHPSGPTARVPTPLTGTAEIALEYQAVRSNKMVDVPTGAVGQNQAALTCDWRDFYSVVTHVPLVHNIQVTTLKVSEELNFIKQIGFQMFHKLDNAARC